MAGYIRQSTFVDGDTITAALFNNEYNQLVNAFSNTSGHKHDGTTAEGPVIGLIGDAGETSPNNKVLIDTTNNYIEFYVEVSSAPVQQLYIADGAIIPVTDSDIDLGTTSLRFKDTYTDTVTTTGNVSIGGDLTVTGSATISGNLTFGDADTDSINLAAEIDSHIVPNTDNTYDLGTTTKEWRNLYIDGTANIDSLVADTADINGGTIDGATIATSDITVGAGKTLNVSAGTLTLADNQISGDKVEGGTIAATTITDLTFGSLNDGTITVTAFVDEDNMVSNSATLIPTQQSVKAYVDSQVTAQDLDFQGDTGGALSIDLDSESLTIAGGTGIDTSGALNTLTVAIDSTVATLTGTQTLTNKTLTSPDVNTPDIDGGTIDGTVIGGATPAAGTFTTLTANTSLTGTLATAAQPNITSLGTLTGLTTTGDINFGDNDKAVFGAGSDLQIYHDGSNSYIEDAGTGSLIIEGTNLNLRANDNSRYLVGTDGSGGSTALYHPDGDSIKLTTTSTGIDVTGTVVADGLTVDTSTLVVDATNNRVGIGTTSPDALLEVAGTTNDALFNLTGAGTNFELRATSGNGATANSSVYRLALDYLNGTYTNSFIDFYRGSAGNNGYLAFGSSGAEAMRIDSSGNVGIGTSSPESTLEVKGASATSNNGATVLVTDSASLAANIGGTIALRGTDGTDERTYGLIKAGKLNSTSGAFDGYLSLQTRTNGQANTTEAIRIDSNQNVGIGTTSPAEQLHVYSTGHAKVEIEGGASEDASLMLTETGSTGFRFNYDGGDNKLFIGSGTAGTFNTKLTIERDSGNVGIGTTSPASKLHVENGTLEVNTDSSAAAVVRINYNSTDSIRRIHALETGGGNARPLQIHAQDVRFRDDTTERMRIDSSGNVGIGTTSIPSESRLSVVGGRTYLRSSDQYTLGIETSAGATGKFIGSPSSDTLSIYNPSGAAEFTLDSSGNVGIGDTSPENRLHVKGAANTSTTVQIESASNQYAPKILFDGLVGASADYLLGSIVASWDTHTNEVAAIRFESGSDTTNKDDGLISFWTSDAGSTLDERMRIDSSGLVGIGTTSPSGELHVVGTSGGNGDVYVGRTSGAEIHTQAQSALGIFGTSSNHDLAFKTNGTQRMRIDTSGNVGIGTSSPLYPLQVDRGATGDIAHFEGQGSTHLRIGEASNVMYLNANNGSAEIAFQSNGSEKMRIDSSGNLTVGGTTIGNAGTVNVSVGSPGTTVGGLQLWSTTGGTHFVQFGDVASGNGYYRGAISYAHATDSMQLLTAGSERMRIDSSGRLLVGTTSTTPAFGTNTGIALVPTGESMLSANSTTALFLNRTTSDGSILDFRKNGTQVGSIGTQSGTDFYITGSTAVATGLRFQANEIVAVNGSAGNRDAAIDIGKSNIRFKDLYLSGGAYLGGTGAANKLDDYEEGTWTPSLSTGTATFGGATYTKVGRLVTCHTTVSNFSDRTSTNYVEIGGLPFTAEDADRPVTIGVLAQYIASGFGSITGGYLVTTTKIRLYNTSSGAYTPLQHNNLTSASSGMYVAFSYMASS
jgi:hypothetical protein